MPTYEYACSSCGTHLEVVQRFSDEPLTVCGACGGTLRKVFHPAGILFKGSGFYSTDSRRGGDDARGGSGSGEGGSAADARSGTEGGESKKSSSGTTKEKSA